MKIIAHRGNLSGSEPNKENTLERIQECISHGFDVEIDLRLIDKNFLLGHDEPEEKIELKEILKLADRLWIHCKNIQVLEEFTYQNYGKQLNFFWHNKDNYTLTSKGYIWSYPQSYLSLNCICVMPEWSMKLNNLNQIKNYNIAGICTDFPNILRK